MKKDIKHSIQFITDKTGKKLGFKTPKNYFDTIENNFFIKLTSKENNTKPFKVPPNYFDTLEDIILSKTTFEAKKETKLISIQKKMNWFTPIAVAASIVLFIGVYFYNNQNSKISFDSISSKDVEFWYENGYGSNNDTAYATALASIDTSKNDLSSIHENDIETYLNSVDNTFILNEIQ